MVAVIITMISNSQMWFAQVLGAGDKKMNKTESWYLEASNQIGEEKQIILMQCGK